MREEARGEGQGQGEGGGGEREEKGRAEREEVQEGWKPEGFEEDDDDLRCPKTCSPGALSQVLKRFPHPALPPLLPLHNICPQLLPALLPGQAPASPHSNLLFLLLPLPATSGFSSILLLHTAPAAPLAGGQSCAAPPPLPLCHTGSGAVQLQGGGGGLASNRGLLEERCQGDINIVCSGLFADILL